MNERFEPDLEAGPVFPDNLQPADLELVRRQCAIQDANSPEQLEGFAAAYLKVKKITETQDFWRKLDPSSVEKLLLELATLIERVNVSGYRKVPASFRDGSLALAAENVPQAVRSFVQGLLAFLEDPTEDESLNAAKLYAEFEKIHPFVDGNGRVGDLIWKILEARKRGEWPLELPPNVFGEKRPGEPAAEPDRNLENSEDELGLAELQAYLNRPDIDLPILRRDISNIENLKWLNQNLGVREDVPDAVIRAIRRGLRNDKR